MSATDPIYGATWYGETMVEAPDRPSLVYELDVDVCVIGGGLAGLTVAREVALRGWSVAVLEAERIAGSASGRNGGMVLPGFAEQPERIVERVGLERAKALWALSLDGVDYVRNAIDEIAMPGVEPIDGWLYVQRAYGPERVDRAAALVGDTFGTEVEVWDIDRVREVLKSERYFQALHFPDAFHIHPLNYALGVAAAAERAGARIFERTRALAIDPAGVRKRIATSGERVRANHVVLAGSAQLAPLFPLVADAVLPVVTYLATTAPLGERLREAIEYSGAVVDTRGVPGYFRVVDNDRLMWGGRVGGRAGAPDHVARTMQRNIRDVFPQFGDVEIAHSWSGTMGYAMHKMPLIGEVSPGLWVATAFGGHGLNTTAMAGDLIARAIIDNDDRWRLFASYDLVWAGGRFGAAARQATTWSVQVGDWIDEKISRRRYAARLRWQRIAAGVAEEARRNVAAEAARIATERVERRHAEAARLVAEEAERRTAAEAARLAARAAERQAAEAAQHVAQEAERLQAAHQAELAAVEAERRAAEALRLATAQADRQGTEVAANLVEEETDRAAEAVRLAVAETDRQMDVEAAQLVAEDAERAAAEAARIAAVESERFAAAQMARIAAQEAERQAAQEEAAALLDADKVERAAARKTVRKKPRTASRAPKRAATEQAKSPLDDDLAPAPAQAAPAAAEEPARKPARRRPARAAAAKPATERDKDSRAVECAKSIGGAEAPAAAVPEQVANPVATASPNGVALPVKKADLDRAKPRRRGRKPRQ